MDKIEYLHIYHFKNKNNQEIAKFGIAIYKNKYFHYCDNKDFYGALISENNSIIINSRDDLPKEEEDEVYKKLIEACNCKYGDITAKDILNIDESKEKDISKL